MTIEGPEESSRSRSSRRAALWASVPAFALSLFLAASTVTANSGINLVSWALDVIFIAAPTSVVLVAQRPRWWSRSAGELSLMLILNAIVGGCIAVIVVRHLLNGHSIGVVFAFLLLFSFFILSAFTAILAAVWSGRQFPGARCDACGYPHVASPTGACSECGAGLGVHVLGRDDRVIRWAVAFGRIARATILRATDSIARRLTLAPGLAVLVTMVGLAAIDVAGHLWLDHVGWDLMEIGAIDEDVAWWESNIGPVPAPTAVPPMNPIAPMVYGAYGRTGAAGTSVDLWVRTGLRRDRYVNVPRWASGAVMTTINLQYHADAIEFPFGRIRTRWIVSPGQPPTPYPFTWRSTVHWDGLARNLAFFSPAIWIAILVSASAIRRG